MIQVTLKDGVIREYEAGTTVAQVAQSLGAGLYKAACAGRVDGTACDLRTPLEKDCQVEILTFEDKDGKHAFWHTAAHIMAQAIQHLVAPGQIRHRPGVGRRLVLRHRRRGALYPGTVQGH